MFKKFFDKVKEQLAVGTSPDQLSLSLTLGILFGVLPFPGVTTALLALLVSIFRLNMLITQFTNYAAHPFQLVLYIPFLRLGKFLGQLHNTSIREVYSIMQKNVLLGLEQVWLIHLWAVAAWLIFSLPAGLILYYLLRHRIRIFALRRAKPLEIESVTDAENM